LEVRVKGRLDGYWADHLAAALEQSIRDGAHRIRLNLSEVPYMSSAGIGVVVKFYKQLGEIKGSLVVSSASAPVKRVIEMAALGQLLAADVAPAQETVMPVKMVGQLDRDQPTFEVRDATRGGKLACRVIGDPALLRGARFGEEHARKLLFPESTFAVGLGAFGNEFEDCSGRFGEFLAVAGAAAYQPTDGTNVPDYLLAAGNLVPELVVLYSVLCEGPFAHLARFEPKRQGAAAGLTDIVSTCLDIAATDTAGIVIVAESAGLMGAALRRSPAGGKSEAAPFQHPEIREWISFTAERAHVRSLTLAAGVASRGDCGALAPMLRPLAKASPLIGHFHAAAFSYRPLKKGTIDLKTTVATLFGAETLQGVLHLLGDDRETGAGQSEFVRGVCWVAPIGDITETK
jgi:anti-anti-sigma factor